MTIRILAACYVGHPWAVESVYRDALHNLRRYSYRHAEGRPRGSGLENVLRRGSGLGLLTRSSVGLALRRLNDRISAEMDAA